jgi:CDP-diglyceride synthetase
MIQRIQSVWLLLSGLSIILLSRLAVYSGKLPDGTKKELMVAENLIMMIIALLMIILPLIAIFLFKNRSGQKKLIWLHILLNFLLLLFFWISQDAFVTEQLPQFTSSGYGLAVFVPVISIILDILAYRGISADEKLIKSADKFR